MYLLFDYKALFMYTVGPFLALSLCSPFPRAGPLTDLSGIYDLEPILWHLAQPSLFIPFFLPYGWGSWPLNLGTVCEVPLTDLPGPTSTGAWTSKYRYTSILCHWAASTVWEVQMLGCVPYPTRLANCSCPTELLILASAPSQQAERAALPTCP